MRILGINNYQEQKQNQNRSSSPNFGSLIELTDDLSIFREQIATGVKKAGVTPFMLFRNLIGGAIDGVAIFHVRDAAKARKALANMGEKDMVDLRKLVHNTKTVTPEELKRDFEVTV